MTLALKTKVDMPLNKETLNSTAATRMALALNNPESGYAIK